MATKLYLMNSDDKETSKLAGSFIEANPEFERTPALGGEQSLGNLRRDTKLAIVAHGTAELAVAVDSGLKKTRWTPRELAQQLENDQLQHDHRAVELLICNAAASVNTVEIAEKLEKLRTQWAAETNLAKKALLEEQYRKLAEESPTLYPQFESIANSGKAPSQTYPDWHAGWLLPFGAALMQEMKNLNYRCLRVLSYKYEVANYTNHKGDVLVIPPNHPARRATEADLVQWL